MRDSKDQMTRFVRLLLTMQMAISSILFSATCLAADHDVAASSADGKTSLLSVRCILRDDAENHVDL